VSPESQEWMVTQVTLVALATLERMVHLEVQANLGRRDQRETKEHQANPGTRDRMEQRVSREMLVKMATLERQVSQELMDPTGTKDLKVLLALLVTKEELDPWETMDWMALMAKMVHPERMVSMANKGHRVIQVQDQGQMDNKESLEKMVLMVSMDMDHRVKKEKLVT